MSTTFSRQTLLALRVLSLGYFVQATGALSVVGSLQPIARTWSLSDAQAADLVTVFGVSFAVSAPLLQIALGHLRRRRQLLLGLGVFAAAALLFALAPDDPTLLASRVLMGVGAGFIGPVLGATGAGLVQRELQGSAIAVVLLGLSVASLGGIPLAAWLAHSSSPRVLFVTVAALSALCAVLVRRHVPDSVPGERIALRQVLTLLARPTALAGFLVMFFIGAAVYATYAFIAPVVTEVYGADAHGVAMALGVVGVAGVLGNLFVTRAARRHSADAMLLAGLVLLAAVLLLLAITPRHLGVLLALLVPWAFATDILWPSQQRRIVELLPAQRGIGLALTASFMFCGIGTGSAIAGRAYARFGLYGLLGASTALLVLASVSLWLSARRHRSKASSRIQPC